MGTAIWILRTVGLLLCGLSVALALTQPVGDSTVVLNLLLPGKLNHVQNEIVGVVAPIVIGLLFWRCTIAPELASASRVAIVLLSVQTVLAFLVAEELQFVIAVEAGLLLSTRVGAAWVFFQAGAAWLVAALNPGLMAWVVPTAGAGRQYLLDIGLLMLIAMLYNFLAYSLGLLAGLEGRQKRALAESYQKLALAHREVQGLQARATEAARLEERLRLARELHDAIGHQLSALSINLQIASRLSQDQAQPHVLEAYQLVGLLLADVRTVVSSFRETNTTDLSATVQDSLQAIAARVPKPVIHLDLSPVPIALQSKTGHALLRCAQEIITNAVRHAQAGNIWIDLRTTADEAVLTAWDDGVGNAGVVGNGLRGLQERVLECGGFCRFANKAQAGFEVNVRVPFTQKAA